MPPPGQSCPICGRMFGRSSLGIHIPQCYDVAVKRWEQQAPRDRGPRPRMPGQAPPQPQPTAYATPTKPTSAPRGGAPVYGGEARDDPYTVDMRSGAVRGSPGGPQRQTASAAGYMNQQRQAAQAVRASPGRTGSVASRGSVASTTTRSSGFGGYATGQYDAGPGAYEAEPGFSNLHPCRYCGRKFNFDRVKRHEDACQHASKHRAKFNSKKQRLGEIADEVRYAQRGAGGGAARRGGASRTTSMASAGGGGGRTNWRQQHNEFQRAMREARRYNAEQAQQQQQRRGPSSGYGGGRPSSYGMRQTIVPGGGPSGGASSGWRGAAVDVAVPARGPPARMQQQQGGAFVGSPGRFSAGSAMNHGRASRGAQPPPVASSAQHGPFGGAPPSRGSVASSRASVGGASRASGRIATSNETSADMRAIFGGR